MSSAMGHGFATETIQPADGRDLSGRHAGCGIGEKSVLLATRSSPTPAVNV